MFVSEKPVRDCLIIAAIALMVDCEKRLLTTAAVRVMRPKGGMTRPAEQGKGSIADYGKHKKGEIKRSGEKGEMFHYYVFHARLSI